MYVRLGIVASVLLASGCSAAVAEDEEASPDRIVTANDLSASGGTLWVDLTRTEAAVRFECFTMSDLARVHVIVGSNPPTTADEMLRVAGVALGKELPSDFVSLRANLRWLTAYRPSPECAGAFPLPSGCCACGLTGHPCAGFVCIEPRSI
jgi:hypothetical protein